MISKNRIKLKSEELNIPFKNLLSAAVAEIIVEVLAAGKYCNELYLCNASDFNQDNYKNHSIGNIYYEFVRDLDDKMTILYMRDILKELMAKGALEAFVINGSVDETGISLKVTVDEMYVPLHIYFNRHRAANEPEKITIDLIAYENRRVEVLTNPVEEELAKHLVEIVDKLELINNMDHYYNTYEILTTRPINGRKVKDRLANLLQEKKIEVDDTRINMLAGYRDYTYMKKKWKVELRQKKKSEPQWTDINDCLISFLRPIWEASEKNQIFLGDWMPQLKRFLD